jgi:hypothetical protein
LGLLCSLPLLFPPEPEEAAVLKPQPPWRAELDWTGLNLHRSCSLDEQGSKPVADWLVRVASSSPRILLVTGTGFPVNLNGVPRHRTGLGLGDGAGGVGVAKLNKSFQKRRGHVPPSVVLRGTNSQWSSMTWGDIPGDHSRARAPWRAEWHGRHGLCDVTR